MLKGRSWERVLFLLGSILFVFNIIVMFFFFFLVPSHQVLSSVYPTQSLKPCTTPFFFLSFHFWRLRNAQPYVCLVVCWVVGSLKKKLKEKKSIIGVFLVVCSGPRDLCELCFLLTKLHCLRRKRWNNKKRNRNKSFLVCIISLFLRVETQGSFCLFLYRFCTFFWFVFKYIYIYI